MDFEGRVAVVTAVGSGIGRMASLRVAEHGAAVAITVVPLPVDGG